MDQHTTDDLYDAHQELLASHDRLLAELQSFVDRWSKYPKKPTGDDLEIYLENAQDAITQAKSLQGGE